MAFKTQEEVLAFFRDEGVMLDTETGVVYQSDVNDQGRFYGIFEYDPVPEEAWNDYDLALEWMECMQWYEHTNPMGCWFDELADEVIAHPERFVTE